LTDFTQTLYKFIGPRIIKTGIATLITAFICVWLDLPAIFAVITAIVSIDPTSYDSINKAKVRFPASVIGSLIAVTSAYFFKESALTYSLSATLTILICHKLKLNEGILVAAITSVAMIPDIHDEFVHTFVTRLFTTTLGIVVASSINFIVLPPVYYGNINDSIRKFEHAMRTLLTKRTDELINYKYISKDSEQMYNQLYKHLNNIEKYMHYQQNEIKYHITKRQDLRKLNHLQNELQYKKLLITHIGNLIFLPNEIDIKWGQREKDALKAIMKSTNSLHTDTHYNCQQSLETLHHLKFDHSRPNEIFKIDILHEMEIIYRMLHSYYAKRNKQITK